MAQTRTPKAQEFDTLVIGGGLSGLIAANALEATGRNVALIEAFDTLGGASRPGQTIAGHINHGLKLFPATDEANAALDWLETVLGEKIERTLIESAPMTYDEGKFKPYVGFGDSSVTTGAEVEAYALHQRLALSSSPMDWVKKLSEQFSGTIFTQSHATRLIVDDGFVIETTINGTKRITAREVIFTAPPHLVPSLVGDAAIAPRVRQKLIKGDFWTSVNLDLVHPQPVTDTPSVHVLKGANEEPTIGVFHEPVKTEDGRTLQVSQWLTLIPRDQIDEEELVAGALKQIKRQLKRAYESALEGIVQERILVIPASHGSLAGAFDEPGRLPKLENLWLTSAFFSDERNTLGALLQTRRVLEALGEPMVDTDLTEDSPKAFAEA
ncbi:MAG: FAD-binding protein [Bdellovibrionales bacterium]|jgi:protoporphyrinogen oxidase|nr:FAD-binding protein [Bdellovibrionales bacterium]